MFLEDSLLHSKYSINAGSLACSPWFSSLALTFFLPQCSLLHIREECSICGLLPCWKLSWVLPGMFLWLTLRKQEIEERNTWGKGSQPCYLAWWFKTSRRTPVSGKKEGTRDSFLYFDRLCFFPSPGAFWVLCWFVGPMSSTWLGGDFVLPVVPLGSSHWSVLCSIYLSELPELQSSAG